MLLNEWGSAPHVIVPTLPGWPIDGAAYFMSKGYLL
jgi:hypothetical protein